MKSNFRSTLKSNEKNHAKLTKIIQHEVKGAKSAVFACATTISNLEMKVASFDATQHQLKKSHENDLMELALTHRKKFTPFILAMHPISLMRNKNCVFAWSASGSYRTPYMMRFWILVNMQELCPSWSALLILYHLRDWYAWKNGGQSVPNWQIVKTSW